MIYINKLIKVIIPVKSLAMKDNKVTFFRTFNGRFGYFILPPLTPGNKSYYAAVFDFSTKKFIEKSGAFNNYRDAEKWLHNQYIHLAKIKNDKR